MDYGGHGGAAVNRLNTFTNGNITHEPRNEPTCKSLLILIVIKGVSKLLQVTIEKDPLLELIPNQDR